MPLTLRIHMVGPVLMLGVYRSPFTASSQRRSHPPSIHPPRSPIACLSRAIALSHAVARLEMALSPLTQHTSIGGLHRQRPQFLLPPSPLACRQCSVLNVHQNFELSLNSSNPLAARRHRQSIARHADRMLNDAET